MTDKPVKPKTRRGPKYSPEPIATVPPIEDLGPAMSALNPRQRQFVMELHLGPTGHGSDIRAFRAAGYGGKSKAASQVSAHQLLYSQKIQDALREVGGRTIRVEAFQAIKTAATIASDITHPQALKAAFGLMDRGGFAVETLSRVEVTHKIDYQAQALEELQAFRKLNVERARLEELYGRDGLYHLEQQLDAKKMIDVTPNRENVP